MLKGILSVSGQPGLFKLIAEAKNRIIVESLLTGKRLPVGTNTKVSSLEDIAIYTNSGDLPLRDVLKKIAELEQGGQTIDTKLADAEIRKYFGTVIPDYDRDKVYVSDIRKVLLWYNILQEKELLVFEEEETAQEEKPEETENTPSE